MKNGKGSVQLTGQEALSPHMMRALGMRLSDTITEFGVTAPEDRLQVMCALMYGEAANEGMSMRQLAEFCAHVWKEQKRIIEAQVAQHRAAAQIQKKGK